MGRAGGRDVTLFLVRHGDRFDYANKELWEARAAQLGFERRDPPLSAIGHAQSRELAAQLHELTGGSVDRILISPYVRVIQTAIPFAHLTSLPLCVEEGLAEVSHAPGTIPAAAQRFPSMPEVSLDYESAVRVVASPAEGKSGPPAELYPLGYFRRQAALAEHLAAAYAGKTVVCFSHAASVALVALLAQQGIREVGRFAPCGIFKLVGRAGGGAWRVELHGGENGTHITTSSPTTYAWGFADSRRAVEESWAQVLEELAEERERVDPS